MGELGITFAQDLEQLFSDCRIEVLGVDVSVREPVQQFPSRAIGGAYLSVLTCRAATAWGSIVTGAASGIGQATALRIAKEGGRVIAADLSKERLYDMVAENAGLDLVPVAGDISTDETVAAVVAAGGRVDALANVAGIMDNFAPIHEVDDDLWDRVFRINVTALMRLTRAVVPLTLEAGTGSVVNVASEAGLRGSAAGAAYTASKHAVVGLTKNSAVMYGPRGPYINAVAPGPTITNIVANWGSQLAAERLGPLMQATVPAPATAAQLAASITFLLSDDRTNVDGAILASDGGWSAL